MRKEIIETGRTVDEAIDAACANLGIERENCEWEIIDLPKKTFLGLKTIPAKVRVSIEVPDEKPAKREPEPPKKQPRQEAKPERRTEQKREPKNKQEAPKEQRPKPPKKADKPERTQQPNNEPQQDFAESEPRILVSEGYTEKETHAVDYISGILRDFGLTAQLQLFREGSGICIDITGEGLGTIIGRRGETLDAIQYLTGLVVNRLEGDYLRVTVDCGDYRMKRKDTLEALAKKLASQVLKTNVSKTLEPMNPFERRVIHAAVSKIEGVSSSSIGEEPNRRVVITSPTARKPSRSFGRDGGSRGDRDGERRGRSGGRSGDRDRGDRGDRGGRGGDRDRDRRRPSSRAPRQQAPSAPVGPPKETPESAVIADTPIGKLDLE